jgi:hypothetical protein
MINIPQNAFVKKWMIIHTQILLYYN